MLLALLLCLASLVSPDAVFAALALALPDSSASVERGPTAQVPTRVEVLVIANGGKFVGDDVGGAFVTVRDARTQEVLGSGRTRGGAGPADLVTVETSRLQETPSADAARFETTLALDAPRLVEVSAYGPLAAEGSAGRAANTVWLLPGAEVNRVVLTLRGLVVQILAPPTHFLPTTRPPLAIALRANVTMMCGCPIGPGYPWRPDDYQVQATIHDPVGGTQVLPLTFDANAPDGAPSQFVGTWLASVAGVYEVVVTAHQPIHDNTGVDRATFILP